MLINKLEDLVAPELEALGFECVKLEVVGSAGSPVVRLYIDKPGGVSIGDCSLVSRSIGLLLDREDPIPGKYLLEVSSPGSDRPLVKEEHYQRFAGDTAKVRTSGKSTYIGKIESCENGLLKLATENEGTVEIRLADVVKASLIGRDYRIDKKTKKSKKKKKVERSTRGRRGGTSKGD
ncbi:MAG: ribosome maturation factor RimP [Candidatus Latescibacterota bacterium]|jgi:ribosome maturation factor RimP